MSSRVESGEALFRTGFNCAQAVLSTFCEPYGLNHELGSKLASCLGKGMCSGEVCGAVSAGVLVIGLHCGSSLPDDKPSKKRCREQTKEFMDAFKARHGSILCRELIARDRQTGGGIAASGQAEAAGRKVSAACLGRVTDAVRLLEAAGC